MEQRGILLHPLNVLEHVQKTTSREYLISDEHTTGRVYMVDRKKGRANFRDSKDLENRKGAGEENQSGGEATAL